MVENLNLMTRKELTDTLKHVSGESFMQLRDLLNSEPQVSGVQPSLDLFLVSFESSVISDISYSLESFTWDLAEAYVQKVEAQANSKEDDENHIYWQTLHEKWGYLEMACD